MSLQKPDWLKVSFNHEKTAEVVELMENLHLHTVCKEANCPNLGACYKLRTATFMILGSRCTRDCRFCNVQGGDPEPLDPQEPERLAQAVLRLGLKHVVITSVTRDDLPRGGAAQFATCIDAVHALGQDVAVEVLTPDFQGEEAALDLVLASGPEVFNHNMETVARLYPSVRPQAHYRRSLEVLCYAHEHLSPGFVKTGIMLGLGETEEELRGLFQDVLDTGCDLMTIGQYLRPSPAHAVMHEYVSPEAFARWRDLALSMGFKHCVAGPLVRSSYMADEAYRLRLKQE